MEVKHCFSAVFLIFLLISASSVRGRKLKDESEIYEIDYRGPETHSSSFPPPDNPNGTPQINRSSTNQLPTQLLHNLKPENSNSATKHKARKTMHV